MRRISEPKGNKKEKNKTSTNLFLLETSPNQTDSECPKMYLKKDEKYFVKNIFVLTNFKINKI